MGVGGAERQLAQLAPLLVKRGHEVEIAVFYSGGAFEAGLAQQGIVIHNLAKSGRWDAIAFLRRLIGLVRRRQPDILHGVLPTSNVLAAIVSMVCPGPCLVFGVRSAGMDPSRYDFLSRLSYWAEIKLAHRADSIVCNSHAGRAWAIAAGMPKERCAVVANGIDIGRFRPDTTHRAAIRREWGIADQDLLVVMPARIDPLKGHEPFIRACAQAAGKRRIRAVCLGDGPEDIRQHYEALAGALNAPVIFRPNRADMPAVYNAADLVVSASLMEGSPNILAEAMACEVPCIGTDVGDTARLLNGLGAVVAPGNAEALAEAIVAAPVARMPAARRHVTAVMGFDRLVDETVGVLEAALARP